ncbi:MAG: hypothetical protein IKW46_01460 [Bacteroidaceae bacterium]|nr:hypothetical protein [Bacteroidaceae bacterium]
MKKIFFIAILSLVSMFSVAARATNVTTSTEKSSVNARISGGEENFDFDTKTLVAIYNLMPQKVKRLCVSSYKSIAPRIEKSVGKRFVYEGVTITPTKTATGINLEFSYRGHTLVVENYTKAEFDKIFGL